ncbi:MAG: hypothetical protein C0606_15935 [Hyphomicrobiales bacterium]|nr:MAG: hypothetical protein C0606_15935 [Hyphomicrobiales bacterium]
MPRVHAAEFDDMDTTSVADWGDRIQSMTFDRHQPGKLYYDFSGGFITITGDFPTIDGNETPDDYPSSTPVTAVQILSIFGITGYSIYELDTTLGEVMASETIFDLLSPSENIRAYGSVAGDLMTGTANGDYFRAEGGNDTVRGGGGNDTLIGNGDGDLLAGQSGHDRIFGGGGNDTMLGAGQSDTLIGGNGRDSLVGGFGNDKLVGGKHNDTLVGGGNQDTLTGNAGNDIFDFNSLRDSRPHPSKRDLITDFKPGTDKIDISDIVDRLNLQNFDPMDAVVRSKKAVIDGKKTTIYTFDMDDNGKVDFTLEFRGYKTLDADDFLV